MYRKLTALALAVTLFVSAFAFTATPADAQVRGNRQVLAGLVNALVNLTADGTQVGLVNVNRSLNNLRLLNNFLNRNDVDITIQDISILNNNEILRNALQNADINIGQVVGVDVLSGGDVIAFVNNR